MQLNRMIFSGFAGQDAVVNKNARGANFVRFPVCYTDSADDGPVWVQVLVYGGWCEVAERVKKGDNVFVEGKLRVTTYRDSTGSERTSVDLVASRVGIIVKDGFGRSYEPPVSTEAPRENT